MNEWLKFSLTSIISLLLGGGAISTYISWKNSQRETKTQKEIARATTAIDSLHEQLDRINTLKSNAEELIEDKFPWALHYVWSEPVDDDKKSALFDFLKNDHVRFENVNKLYREIKPYLRNKNLDLIYYKYGEDGNKEIIPSYVYPHVRHTEWTEKYQKLPEDSYSQKIIPGNKEIIFEAYKLDILYKQVSSAHGKAWNPIMLISKQDKRDRVVETEKIENELHKKLVNLAVNYADLKNQFQRNFLKTIECERKSIISEMHNFEIE